MRGYRCRADYRPLVPARRWVLSRPPARLRFACKPLCPSHQAAVCSHLISSRIGELCKKIGGRSGGAIFAVARAWRFCGIQRLFFCNRLKRSNAPKRRREAGENSDAEEATKGIL